MTRPAVTMRSEKKRWTGNKYNKKQQVKDKWALPGSWITKGREKRNEEASRLDERRLGMEVREEVS